MARISNNLQTSDSAVFVT